MRWIVSTNHKDTGTVSSLTLVLFGWVGLLAYLALSEATVRRSCSTSDIDWRVHMFFVTWVLAWATVSALAISGLENSSHSVGCITPGIVAWF